MVRLPSPPVVLVLALLAGLAIASCADAPRDEPEPSDTGITAARVAAAFEKHPRERIPREHVFHPGTPYGPWVGSAACARCHAEDHKKWMMSFHSRTLYEANEHTVIGDFSGDVAYEPDRTHKASAHQDERLHRIRNAFIAEPFHMIDPSSGRKRMFMRVGWRPEAEGGLPPAERSLADTYGAGSLPDLSVGTVEVLYAFGNRNHQPYVARWPDGRHWVLPIYWNDVDKRWLYDGFRPYIDSCASCHTTGIETSDVPTYAGQMPLSMSLPPVYPRSFLNERWADGAVGCEACHGPGREHVREVERIGIDRYRELLQSGAKEPTIWDGRRGNPEHVLDMCGQCHNFSTESPCTWKPGPQGFARDPLRLPLDARNDPGGFQHYEDGSPKSPCVVVAVYRGSKMHAEGVGCFACHDPHGTELFGSLLAPIEDNSLCTKCHQEYATVEAQTSHSRHLAGSAGNLCVECHMPRHMSFTNGEQIMSKLIYSHAFNVPTGERRPGGPASSCNICHEDRDHEWTRATLAEWRRAATVAPAGSATPGAEEDR